MSRSCEEYGDRTGDWLLFIDSQVILTQESKGIVAQFQLKPGADIAIGNYDVDQSTLTNLFSKTYLKFTYFKKVEVESKYVQ